MADEVLIFKIYSQKSSLERTNWNVQMSKCQVIYLQLMKNFTRTLSRESDKMCKKVCDKTFGTLLKSLK